ncbi:MAG TPA: AraC family transcriptional regulator [Saprospiraceae bacterium]|nr:AraC family transcriptional regulator [Saprospiraceae bacterium]HMQ85609.1 AraC family transcriptional regulator [Saprospiraceae bacterium]
MVGYFKGEVRQAVPGAVDLHWRNAQPSMGNDLRISKISEADATLDTSKFHIAMPLVGKEIYVVDNQPYQSCPGEYFILNPKQHARAEGIFKENVEGICLFLSIETISEVAHFNRFPINQVVDSPFDFPWQQHEFIVKNYRLQENSFGRYLMSLKSKLLAPEVSPLMDWDTFYFNLAAEFLWAHQQIGKQLQSISCVQALTKQEIYKRLSIAYGFILENFAEPISLEDLCRVTFFSKYYIIRLYRQIYGLTPYQHILYLRIEKAKELLKKDFSPTVVSQTLSFSDRRAFSKVFKKMEGISPSEFQQQ